MRQRGLTFIRQKRGRGFLAAIAMTLAVVACGSAPTSQGPTGDYQLGVTSDLTGPFKAVGVPVSDGIRTAAEGINKRGGVNGHKVILTARDDASDGAKGLANIREFATSVKASGVLGMNSSVAASGAGPAAVELQIPIVGMGLPTSLLRPVSPYNFMVEADYDKQAAAQVTIAKQLSDAGTLPKNLRIALLWFQTPAGQAWHDQAVKTATSLGLTPVESQSVVPGAADYSAPIQRLQTAKPDAIALFMTSAGVVPAVTKMKSVGFPDSTMLIGFNSTTTASFMKSLPWTNFISLSAFKEANGGTGAIFTNLAEDAKTQGIDSLAQPNQAFLEGYVLVQIVAEALNKCGYPCPGDKLKSALEKTSTNVGGLAFGTLVFSPTSHSAVTVVGFEKYDSAKGGLVPVGQPVVIKSEGA